ncbi:G-protein coupled receptor family C group 5 member B-like isoform X3 [Paramormyrops kingsleyae]|uniref:G-protein coupled receptor family C group 5 member B-like isoform X3 n=1 Tax=Paramormyrops kingsleyae TaxID=1676925 RepID=UPI003B9745C5
MASVNLLLFLLAGLGLLGDEASRGGCNSLLMKPFPTLCEFGTVTGVAVLTAVGGAALVSLFLALLLLCRLFVTADADRRREAIALLLIFIFIFTLCGLSVVYLSQFACNTQNILLVVLYLSCLACLLTHGTRHFCSFLLLLERYCNPCIRVLGKLAVALFVVLGFIGVEWLAETVGTWGQLKCLSKALYFFMPLMFVVVLLSAALLGKACIRRRQRDCKRRVALLLVTCFTSALLWATRGAFYLSTNAGLGIPSNWDNFKHVMVLLGQAWLLLLLHAVPETHAWLNPAPEPTLPETIDALWAPPQMAPSSFIWATSLSSWQSGDPQGSWSDNSSARSSSCGPAPGAPFTSSRDQSTRITIQDEEAVTSTSV